MIKLFAIALGVIFLLLSLIHFKWAFFGIDNVRKVFPVIESEKIPKQPKVYHTLIVALGLLLFSLFYFWKAQIILLELPSWIPKYVVWIIPSVFLIRGIGDFKYVGIFSKMSGTEFGRLDKKFYSPLCLFLALTGYFIAQAS